MPSRVEVTISAQDNASPTLDKVRQQLEMFPTFARNVDAVGPPLDQASRSFADFDVSASKATRAVRGLAVPLISELSPALGGTASAMGQVVSSALLLGSGMGALVIGATVLAGIVGGKLITAWQQSRGEMESWHRALQSSDPGFFSERMKTLTRDLLDAGKAFEDAKRRLATAAPDAAPGALPGVGGFGSFPGSGAGPGDVPRLFGLGGRTAAEADVERLRQEWLKKNDEFLRARAEFEARVSNAEEMLAFGVSDRLLRQGPGDTAAVRRANEMAQRGAFDYRLPSYDADYQKALRAADELERGTGKGGDPAAAAAARDVARRQRDIARGFALSAGELDLSTIPAISGKEQDVALQRAREARGLELGAGEPDFSSIPRLFGTEPDIALATKAQAATREQAQIAAQLLDIDRQRFELAGQLTPELSAQITAMQTAALLSDKTLTDDQKRLIVAQGQLAELHAMAQLDPAAGLRRGLVDIEVEFGSAGLRMQSLMQNIGGGMAGALDDTFFSVVTGKFQDLPDIARRFGSDMVRAFTGELAKMATAAVFGQLRSSFESLFPGGASGTSPFGAGSGGGGYGYHAGGGSGGGPMLTAAGRPLAESEIATAYAAEGDAGVRALREGRATVVGGEFVTDTVSSPEVTQSAYALNPATPVGSGFGWRQGLGIAGSAALLGLTAYGATGARSNLDVGTSAAMGALTGATLGGQVGGAFGYGGTGAAVGAVVGAAVNTTIALLAKQAADKETAKLRQAAELERAAGAGTDLVRAAAGATSIADLQRRITAFGSGYTGGTANPAVSTTVMTPTGPRPIGIENPTYPVATLQDLLAAPESLRANIQAGVSPESLAGPNAATSTALQAIAKDLVDQFREAEMGVGLTQEDQVGGLTRRTTYPASRADMLDPTRDLEIDELALNALSDDDRAILLLDVLGRVAVERDIQSTISDGATGQIVSITRIARSTIGLPGLTAPAGLTAEQAAALQATVSLNIPRFTEPPPATTTTSSGGPIHTRDDGSLYELIADASGTLQAQDVTVVRPTAEQMAAYQARRAEFYRPFVEELAATAKAQLSALTPANVQGAIQAGLLTPADVAVLVRAGLLPNITELLSPEMVAALMAGDAGGDPGVPGEVGETSGIPDSPVTTAVTEGLIAALSSATFGLSGLVAPSNLSWAQSGLATVATVVGMLAGIPGMGTLASFGFGFMNSVNTQADLTTAFGLANTAPHADVQGMIANALGNFPSNVAGLSESGFNLGQLAADFANNPNTFSFPRSWSEFFGIPDAPATPDGVSPTTGLATTGDPNAEGMLSTDPSEGGVGDGDGGGDK